jgi:hypothetical protein
MIANNAVPASVPQRISSIFFNFMPVKKRYLLKGQIPLVLEPFLGQNPRKAQIIFAV